MERGSKHPLGPIGIAMLACISLSLLNFPLLPVVFIFILWTGSLYLAFSQPPPSPAKNSQGAISSESMNELIQHSGTPLLVIEKGIISIANREAQQVLGHHIVGQDWRMAFRQPKAISLLTEKKNASTIVKGLVRRRDIWRLRHQIIDEAMAVIELTNLTAEADMSRAHTDFVANASHELRTPLSSIIGYAETLRDDSETINAQTSKKFVETIHKEAQRLKSLVNDLMSLSRIEANKHDEPNDIIELSKIVQTSALDAAGAERSSRLNIKVTKNLCIKGDQHQIEQLVRNLVDNALKYGSPTKDVLISLSDSDQRVITLRVQDHGTGIPPEHVPHLTRRFYRTDPARSIANGGTGLGLAIVKHIVERHRGRLDIQSVLGEGTAVEVEFPIYIKDATLVS